MHNCLFCKIIAGIIPSTIVAQTSELLVIKDISPQKPIHYLILPKEHIINVKHMTDKQNEKYGSLFLKMAQHLSEAIPGAQDFKLVTNNGGAAGQVVFHLHIHFLAGYNKDSTFNNIPK